MRKIQLEDILDIARYELKREEYRKKILDIKASRRIFIGRRITFLFENFDTMLYQVQEMMRAERIVREEAILQEINVYNDLIPDENQLSATMLIASGNKNDDFKFLSQMSGLQKHTFLEIDREKVYARYDDSQIDDERMSSVQYVKFNLSEGQVARFGNGSAVFIGFDHKNYTEKYELVPEQKEILKQDLAQP